MATACILERCQRTLKNSVTISGTGLHSGDKAVVTIHPATVNAGIVFGGNGSEVRGLVSNVVDTSRGTTLGSNGTRVRTVEHLLAALRGTGVDNAFVEVQGPEMPALDGSALGFVEAIGSVGTIEQPEPKTVMTLSEPIWVRANGSYILAVPSSRLRITYIMRYEHPLIGSQSVRFVLQEKQFAKNIAPARTFVLYEELAGLKSQQLARGGSIQNAIVVWRDRVSSDLRFRDEFARHKVLDLVGDMTLLGEELRADIVAVKSGHALNVEFVRQVREAAKRVN
jgi:UDP-3-O-[3-hydroxymyristoyl] N-acetylglucosamine deacetylase